jgi:hypothetical protein
MLITRYTYKYFPIFLAISGAIFGIVKVALGLGIIYNKFRILLKM